jgi:hypothetical protein
MRQSQTGFLLAVLVSTIAAPAQQGVGRGSSPADMIYAQAGQLVDVGGFRLNLYCTGKRLAHGRLRFRMGRLGASLVNGAATDRQVDARL